MRKIPDFLLRTPTGGEKTSSFALDVALPLEIVTPIIGGGVESLIPDKVDSVRVPSIRGALRSWWRAIVPEIAPAELFWREVLLWGGVSVGDGRAGVRSLVEVSVTVTKVGEPVAAGTHRETQNGPRLSPSPDWGPDEASAEKYKKLDYALFPLQHPEAKLDSEHRNGKKELGTKKIRTELAFELHLRIRDTRGSKLDPLKFPALAHEVLAAAWLWVHFGGLGARTTRGFGGLRTTDGLRFGGFHSSLTKNFRDGWSDRFSPSKPFFERAKGVLPYPPAPGVAVRSWPHFDHARLLVGPVQADAITAQGVLVSALKNIRQGPGLGRKTNSKGGTGGSLWPETNWMRAIAELEGYEDNLYNNAPRAAFGLPLEMKFKSVGGSGDDRANGRIIPLIAGRLTSPLRICAVFDQQTAKGKDRWLPMALVFANRVDTVRTDRAGGPTTKVEGSEGANGKIAELIDAGTPEDGVGAFVHWLMTHKSFESKPVFDHLGGIHE